MKPDFNFSPLTKSISPNPLPKGENKNHYQKKIIITMYYFKFLKKTKEVVFIFNPEVNFVNSHTVPMITENRARKADMGQGIGMQLAFSFLSL